MHSLHRFRFGDGQILVASLQLSATEVISGQVESLKTGAGRTVKNKNGALRTVEMIKESGSGDLSCHLRRRHGFPVQVGRF